MFASWQKTCSNVMPVRYLFIKSFCFIGYPPQHPSGLLLFWHLEAAALGDVSFLSVWLLNQTGQHVSYPLYGMLFGVFSSRDQQFFHNLFSDWCTTMKMAHSRGCSTLNCCSPMVLMFWTSNPHQSPLMDSFEFCVAPCTHLLNKLVSLRFI